MRYAALLRGVNVGGKNRVPMGELRELLAALGFTDVATLLNSGNAVFTARGSAATHAKAIAAALVESLGVDVPVIVKTAAEVDDAIEENPLRDPRANPSALLVAFAQRSSDLEPLRSLESFRRGAEQMHVGSHAAYFYFADGMRDSKLGAAVLGKGGRSVTTRNWATVLKLRDLLSAR